MDEDGFGNLADSLLDSGAAVGVQIFVAEASDIRVDIAHGQHGFSTDSILPWRCLTKVPVAVATLNLAWNDALALDDATSKWIPEVEDPRIRNASIRDLMDHRVAFRNDPPGESLFPPDWPRVRRVAASARAEAGERYSPWFGYNLLGIVAELAAEKALPTYCRASLFEPLGMTASRLALEPMDVHRLTPRLMASPRRTPLERMGSAVDDPRFFGRCVPSSSGRGPANELGRLLMDLVAENPVSLLFPLSAEWTGKPRPPGWRYGFRWFQASSATPQVLEHGSDSGVALIEPSTRRVAVALTLGVPGWPAMRQVGSELRELLGTLGGRPGRRPPLGMGSVVRRWAHDKATVRRNRK